MKTFQGLVAFLFNGQVPPSVRARARAEGRRRSPVCEGLEGRALLTAGATGAGLGMLGLPGFPGGQLPSGRPPADLAHLDARGGTGAHAFHAGAHGQPGAGKFTMSAQLKTDLGTLQTDLTTPPTSRWRT